MPEETKTPAAQKVAVAIAAVSTYIFFLKLLFF